MNHYDALGVPRDASTDQIKKAWRKKAKAQHPDRANGDATEMAKTNAAYEVLADPQRRAQYDGTGQDVPPMEKETRVELMVMQAFQSVAARPGNMIKNAHGWLEQAHQKALVNGAEAHNAATKVKERIARLSRKGEGKNLAKMVLEPMLQSAQHAVNASAEEANLLKEAMALCKLHQDSTPVQEAPEIFRGAVFSARY